MNCALVYTLKNVLDSYSKDAHKSSFGSQRPRPSLCSVRGIARVYEFFLSTIVILKNINNMGHENSKM